MSDFTHFNEQGRAKMVDVGEKPISQRIAVAAGRVLVNAHAGGIHAHHPQGVPVPQRGGHPRADADHQPAWQPQGGQGERAGRDRHDSAWHGNAHV